MFDGWVPLEVHEHFDIDGVLTGTTVIHRQSEWDDETRARAVRLADYEAGLCFCGCGRSIAETSRPDQAYMVHKYICMADKAIQTVRRKEREQHKDAPEGWDSGLHYYAEPAESKDQGKPGVKRGN